MRDKEAGKPKVLDIEISAEKVEKKNSTEYRAGLTLYRSSRKKRFWGFTFRFGLLLTLILKIEGPRFEDKGFNYDARKEMESKTTDHLLRVNTDMEALRKILKGVRL